MKNILLLQLILWCASSHHNSNVSYVDALNIYVDTHEVTVLQYETYINQSGYSTSEKAEMKYFDYQKKEWLISSDLSWEKPNKTAANPNHPVTQVDYADACAYCAYQGGRLPTAKEWTFYAGKFIDANIWYGLFPFKDYNTDGYKAKMAPVKQFSVNEYHLYDVYGNAWELTSDTNDSNQVAIKGGSYLCDFSLCSGTQQLWVSQNKSSNDIGFRCVYDQKPKH